MGGTWLGVGLRLILLVIVVPAMLVLSIVATILSGFLGGGGQRGYGDGSSFGFLQHVLDPTRHLTGSLPGRRAGGPMDQLFEMLMRSLDGGRPW